MNPDWSQLVPVLLTIGIYTLLIKETKVYRLIEHIFVGTTMGYTLVVAIRTINTTGVAQVAAGNYFYLLAFVLGIMIFARFFGTKYSWLNRYPVSILVGTSIGVTFRGLPEQTFLSQLRANFVPLLGTANPITSLNNIVIFVFFFFSLLYFVFTMVSPGRVGKIPSYGRYFLMLYFGAMYGNVIIQRAAMFIPRIQFLILDFLRL